MDDLTGTKLQDRYFLRELLGTGGMADVYLAWDKLRSVKLAIKVLRKDLAANPRFLDQFSKEADLLRKLEHPHIVRIYEFAQQEEIVYYVMDFIEGASLRKVLDERKKPFSLDEISQILHPVCTALQYAHQNQVYHCDIKPANILLHVDGRVLLSDFGIARLANESTRSGTPPYMAPEQFTGEPVDGRTDIYGLGVTLYEVMSGGHLPFRGDTPNSEGSTQRERIAWEHLNLPMPPLRQFAFGLPEAVEAVIVRALSKEPGERYASALALLDAFELARPSQEKGESIWKTVLRPEPKQVKPPTENRPSEHPPKPAPASVSHAQTGRGPYLYVRSGEYAGQYLTIPPAGLTIGRSSQCQLRVGEMSVSRSHATIFKSRQGYCIRDENSALGTFLNGQRIQGVAKMYSGDIIQVGYQQIFEFHEK
jgi:serine/threonine protein kinase